MKIKNESQSAIRHYYTFSIYYIQQGLQTFSSWVLNSCSHQPPKQSWHSLPILIFSISTQSLITFFEILRFFHCLQIEEITVPL